MPNKDCSKTRRILKRKNSNTSSIASQLLQGKYTSCNALDPRFNEDSLVVTATTDATVDALVNEGPAIDVVTRHEEDVVKLGALFNLPFSKFLRFVPAELWPLELEHQRAAVVNQPQTPNSSEQHEH
uniref:Uncharacterized protein n=1 Tax=Glossina pallidipes TaxID=7398 RepID=A0A1A9ZM27_GLOPL